MWRKVGVFRPSDCNTRLVLKRFYKGSDRGAVVMLVAVLAGSGALLALIALSVDAGRLFIAHNQVQSAADSTVQGVIANCQVNKVCPSQVQMLQKITATLAGSGASLVGACWDTGTPILGPGGQTCTTPGDPTMAFSSDTFTATCPTLLNDGGVPIGVGGVYPYFRVVVHSVQPVASLFLPRPDATFTACGQGVWWTGTSYKVPVVMLLPACMLGVVGTGNNHLLWQQNPASNKPPAIIPGGCDPVTWGAIDPPSTRIITAPDTTNWIDELGQMLNQVCTTGNLSTVQLTINGVAASGTKLLPTVSCSAQQIAAYFNPANAGGANPRPMALGTKLVDANNTSQVCTSNDPKQCLVVIGAFARFYLTAIFDGNMNCWYAPSASETNWARNVALPDGTNNGCGTPKAARNPVYDIANNPWSPTTGDLVTGGAYYTTNGYKAAYCQSKADKLCLYGYFTNVEVAGYGGVTATTSGYAVRP